jgi:hypothetical protein
MRGLGWALKTPTLLLSYSKVVLPAHPKTFLWQGSSCLFLALSLSLAGVEREGELWNSLAYGQVRPHLAPEVREDTQCNHLANHQRFGFTVSPRRTMTLAYPLISWTSDVQALETTLRDPFPASSRPCSQFPPNTRDPHGSEERTQSKGKNLRQEKDGRDLSLLALPWILCKLLNLSGGRQS